MAIQFDNSNGGSLTLKNPSSGSYNIVWPASNGSSGYFLQTDGAGTLSWAVASGGVTGFTSALNTTGTNATINVSSLTASGGSTNQHAAMVPKGTGGILGSIPDGTATGGNARGNYSVDLQLSRLNASEVASGNYSTVLGGQYNTASGDYSAVVNGMSNQATATYSAVLNGTSNAAWGNYSVVLGGSSNISQGLYSTNLGGRNGTDRSGNNSLIFGSAGGGSGTWGSYQMGIYVLGANTTDATATVMVVDASAAGQFNQVTMAANTAYYFQMRVCAGVTGAANTKSWTVTGLITRGATVGTTAFIGTPTVTSDFASAGASAWTLAVTADTTNGCVKTTVTGAAATTIRWTGVVYTSQVGY